MFLDSGVFSDHVPELDPSLGKPVDDSLGRFYMPEQYDLMPTGRCMFRCAGCWGPHHSSVEHRFSAEHWLGVALHAEAQNSRYRTLNHGPRSTEVCVSGGEPLLYWDILNLLQALSRHKISTTLSTTGNAPEDLFERAVTSGIRELGIPIDASDGETNGVWRKGKLADGGLASAIRGIKVAQEIAPNVLITIRTLIHDGNARSIEGIPNMLDDHGVDSTLLNWKGYLFNGNTGPRIGQEGVPSNGDLDGLRSAIASLLRNKDRFAEVSVKATTHTHPRLLVGPNGACTYTPIRDPDSEVVSGDVHVGNIFIDPEGLVRSLNGDHREFLANTNNSAGMDMLIEIIRVPFSDLTHAQRRLIMEGLLGLEMPASYELGKMQ